MRLIIATKNKSKLKEIKAILAGFPFEIVSLRDLPKKFTLREDGKSFFENAAKKSLPVSKAYKNDYVVGEDSGLSVEHLGGEPGLRSRRYSKEDATDFKNNRKLLKLLQNLPQAKRKAEFVCCLSLAVSGKEIANFKGQVKGLINNQLQGKEGFGYDPLFYLPNLKKTMAQLSLDRKNKISHRAKAFYQLKKFLQQT